MAKSGGSNDEFEITGINVTPLVDIMLVLLIIFLVTATYIVKQAIRIELPKASTSADATAHTVQLVISKDGKTYLNGVESNDAAIARRIRMLPDKKEDLQAVISADRDTRHGAVVHALDVLRTEGVTKFAIEVERERKE
jgi:biopolymer transport protein TolR